MQGNKWEIEKVMADGEVNERISSVSTVSY